ncbi:MAG: epoxyqueuosine reductase [Methylocystaceae bacterium]
MLTKDEVILRAREIGFADIGFTTTEEFSSQRQILEERAAGYEWAEARGLNLMEGVSPLALYPEAKSMIVVLENYHQYSFPTTLLGKFGRCYLDDDRVTKDGLAVKIKALRSFLRDHGIDSKVPAYIPHRLAAARAGVGNFGKNNLLYATRTARQSSWVLPVVLLVNQEFAPDTPHITMGCPEWCRNVCIAACPTRALTGAGKIDPRRCISYLTYYGEGITPLEFREPMGTWIYGCDRCQTVCPRNEAWLAQDLPLNPRVVAKDSAFALPKLLAMDENYFREKIWPHMFYMSARNIWRWKMNVARAMGNSRDPSNVPYLIKAFAENEDERVQGMIAWALGRLGGQEARTTLTSWQAQAEGMVQEEISNALLGLTK